VYFFGKKLLKTKVRGLTHMDMLEEHHMLWYRNFLTGKQNM